MANTLLYCTYIIIFFSICIDRGDGRWKEKGKKNLQRDIQLFREVAENVQREIEDFYVYYPDIQKEEEFYDQIQSFTKHNEGAAKSATFLEFDTSESMSTHKYQDESAIEHKKTLTKSPVNFMSRNNDYPNNTKWPIFDELLLSVGKKYDWKNDRWIKVKQKRTNSVNINEPKTDFVSKHKFNYRFVKLSRSKSKRNVILAVKAGR